MVNTSQWKYRDSGKEFTDSQFIPNLWE